MYWHGNGPDQHTETFNKAKEHLILNIKSELVNGSDISESICKGAILYLNTGIPIKNILAEDVPSREEPEKESFKSMQNI